MSSKKSKKVRPGRKPIDPKEKVRNFSTYLTDEEGQSIIKKYGSVTESVRKEVLPKVLTIETV